VHAGEEDHAWPGWTTSRRGLPVEESVRMTEYRDSTSSVWPTLGSRRLKNRTVTGGQSNEPDGFSGAYRHCLFVELFTKMNKYGDDRRFSLAHEKRRHICKLRFQILDANFENLLRILRFRHKSSATFFCCFRPRKFSINADEITRCLNS